MVDGYLALTGDQALPAGRAKAVAPKTVLDLVDVKNQTIADSEGHPGFWIADWGCHLEL